MLDMLNENQREHLVELVIYKSLNETNIPEETIDLFRDYSYTYAGAIEIGAIDFVPQMEEYTKKYGKNLKTELAASNKHLRILFLDRKTKNEAIDTIRKCIKPLRQAFLTLQRNYDLAERLTELAEEHS